MLIWGNENTEILSLIYAILSWTDQYPALQTSSPSQVSTESSLQPVRWAEVVTRKGWKPIFRAAWGRIITRAGDWSFCQTITKCRGNPLLQIVESKEAESYFEMAHCLFSSSEAP